MPHDKIREVTALYEIARLAAASLDLDATLAAILGALAEHLEVARGTLTLLDPRTGHLAVRASHGLTKSEMKHGLYQVAARGGRQAREPAEHHRRHQAHAGCFPLR